MSGANTSIAVSPGRVSLDDLAQVLAGASVMLDPSFWQRVEAARTIRQASEALRDQLVSEVCPDLIDSGLPGYWSRRF